MNELLKKIIFSDVKKPAAEYEELYAARGESAKVVTRLGPSPTGFIHFGNLYGAYINERLAHRNGGIFYLRIEDTDSKRQVEGAKEEIRAVASLIDAQGVKAGEYLPSKIGRASCRERV